MKVFKIAGILAICAAALGGCKKETSYSGTSSISYEFQGESSLFSLSSLKETSPRIQGLPGVSWTKATLNLAKVELTAKNESGEAIQKIVEDLENINLLMPGQSFGDISIPKGVYADVIVKLSMKKGTGTTIPLTLKAALFSGTTQVPVEFYFNEDALLSIAAGKLDASGDRYVGLIKLQLMTLLSQLSLTEITNAQKTDGVVVISNTSNVALYNLAKTALSNSYTINIERK